MATLNETMNETADAIREKTGKSELIKPIDFATEIKGITAGGSGESGGSNWRYFDVSNDKGNSYVSGHIIKAKAYGMTCIIPFGTLDFLGANVEKKAIGIDMNVGYCEMGTSEVVPYGTTIEASLGDWFADGIVEITKEQFYDLNA